MRISTRRICKTIFLVIAFSLSLSFLSILSVEQSQGTKRDTATTFPLTKKYGRKLSVEADKQVVADALISKRRTHVGLDKKGGHNLLKRSYAISEWNDNQIPPNLMKKEIWRETVQSDIFISVKTTRLNRESRLQLQLDTWIPMAKDETYIFTDNDTNVPENFPVNHFINTGCPESHYRRALCCKMGKEYDIFMSTKNKRWFCHVDDDNYVNVPALTKFLRAYNHSEEWYIGKPSIFHPLEVMDRANPGQKLAFWFATGGAGFCISRKLAQKMLPHAGGGRIETAGDSIRLPDDVTMGFIINYLLKVPLTQEMKLHSHLESLQRIPVSKLSQQLTFSYSKTNQVEIKGYSKTDDPSRFKTIHCYLYPYLNQCADLPR